MAHTGCGVAVPSLDSLSESIRAPMLGYGTIGCTDRHAEDDGKETAALRCSSKCRGSAAMGRELGQRRERRKWQPLDRREAEEVDRREGGSGGGCGGGLIRSAMVQSEGGSGRTVLQLVMP